MNFLQSQIAQLLGQKRQLEGSWTIAQNDYRDLHGELAKLEERNKTMSDRLYNIEEALNA